MSGAAKVSIIRASFNHYRQFVQGVSPFTHSIGRAMASSIDKAGPAFSREKLKSSEAVTSDAIKCGLLWMMEQA